MNIDTIETLLPNGFHDAYLVEFSLHFLPREVRLILQLLVGGDDKPVSERYRMGSLSIREYAVVILELPVAYRKVGSPRGLQVDRTILGEGDVRAIVNEGYRIPTENFWLALFVYEWNSRVIINARDADLNLL